MGFAISIFCRTGTRPHIEAASLWREILIVLEPVHEHIEKPMRSQLTLERGKANTDLDVDSEPDRRRLLHVLYVHASEPVPMVLMRRMR